MADVEPNTSLIKAIHEGNNELARDLIAQCEDVNIPNGTGKTVLASAVSVCNKEIVKMLIDVGADVNQRACLDSYQYFLRENGIRNAYYGITPLYIAACNNDEEVLGLLIESGANVNLCNDENGGTPIFAVARIARTVVKDNKNVARLLIDKGADINVFDEHGNSPLAVAARSNRTEIAELLIEKGADVNVFDEHGNSPLAVAARSNRTEMAELLIEKGADVNVFDEDEKTPLCYAADHGNVELVRRLIEKGADVNISNKYALLHNDDEVTGLLIESGADINVFDEDGNSPLVAAASNNYTPLAVAARSNRTEIAEFLIEKGDYVNVYHEDERMPLCFAYVNQSDKYMYTTPLLSATQGNNVELVRRELIEKRAYVNQSDKYMCTTPLLSATKGNNVELARLLIESGADVNVLDLTGRSPLGIATKSNYKQVAHLLIENGADVNALVEYDGKTPLYYAASFYKDKLTSSLLISKGADVNAFDKFEKTLLLSEAERNNEEAARLLIEIGANVNLSDEYGQTALHFAAATNSKDVARLLIEKGADVNASDNYGRTPFILAAAKIFDVSLLLIENGADINIADEHGRTALFYLVMPFDHRQGVGDQSSHLAHMLTLKVASDCSNIDKRDNEGQTVLFYAIKTMNTCEGCDKPALAKVLIDTGAKVNVADNNGETPLFFAFTDSSVRLLLDHGGDLTLRNNQMETVLIHAIKYMHTRDEVLLFGRSYYSKGSQFNHLRTLINFSSLEINARDMFGRTALFYAAMACNSVPRFKEIVIMQLLDQGANLRTVDSNGVSVLSYFIEKNCCDESLQDDNDVSTTLTFWKENAAVFLSALNFLYCILPKYLHGRNAAINQKGTKIIANTIAVATKYASDPEQLETLKALLLQNKISEAMEVLLGLGVNPNSADSYGNTALHYATLLSFNGCSQEYLMKILHTLENHGVRFNVRNLEKETPLHFCLSEKAWRGFREISPSNGIERRWEQGQTEIKNAFDGMVEICKFLLQDGSLVMETTRNGESVYHLMTNLFRDVLSTKDEEIREIVCQNAVYLLEMLSRATVQHSNVLMIRDRKLNSPLHLWASLSLPMNQSYAAVRITNDFTFQKLLYFILKHLLKPGSTPNPRNEDDQTPLHLCKTWIAVNLLIKEGANTNCFDKEGRTPLLNIAKQQVLKTNINCRHNFFPDLKEDPKIFFETCVSLNLDIWSSDNHGQSLLDIILQSEVFELANAYIEVACCKSNTLVLKHLLETICQDKSNRATWKSLLVTKILTSKHGPFDLHDALQYCVINIKKMRDQGQEFAFGKPLEPPVKKPKNNRGILPEQHSDVGLTSVHVDIARQLLLHGADGNTCTDLCQDFLELRQFLTTEIDFYDVPPIIPWTSHSTVHKTKLARVSRKQNVQKIGNCWFNKDPIGRGSFGHIFAGINEKDGREIAIKKIEKLRMMRPEDEREIRNLTALADCPKVVSYISFDDSDTEFVYIVLELMEGDLDHYFENCTFDVSQASIMCKDVVEGLSYLHQHKPKSIIHRDIKPGNILYKIHPSLCLKIADFGLSTPVATIGTTVYGTNVGTRCWIAPEVISSGKYEHSKSSDVFSCGLLLHYILSNQNHPFSPADSASKVNEIVDHETQDNMLKYKLEGWNNALSLEATHLIKGMLHIDHSQRPSAVDSLHHPFFWSRKKRMEFLKAVGNQYEFQCPTANKAASHFPMTGVEADLKRSLAKIVPFGKWDDPRYKDMAQVVTEMNNRIERVNKNGKTYYEKPRTCDTGSVVELVRFIRNATEHVSEPSRPADIRKLILDDFVFLREFPHLLIEVYKAVVSHRWDNRKEIKYAMTSEDALNCT